MECPFKLASLACKRASLVWLLLMQGCFPFSEYDDKHLTGHYYLCEAEADSGTWYLHFDDERFGLAGPLIPERLVQVGLNSTCIIMQASGNPATYYVAPLRDNDDRTVARKSIVGPLSEAEFTATTKSLSANEAIKFDPDFTAVD